jgi:hypothetical protein
VLEPLHDPHGELHADGCDASAERSDEIPERTADVGRRHFDRVVKRDDGGRRLIQTGTRVRKISRDICERIFREASRVTPRRRKSQESLEIPENALHPARQSRRGNSRKSLTDWQLDFGSGSGDLVAVRGFEPRSRG